MVYWGGWVLDSLLFLAKEVILLVLKGWDSIINYLIGVVS